MATRYTSFDSPIGPLLVAGDEHGLRRVSLPSERSAVRPDQAWIEDTGAFGEARRQFDAYFRGDLRDFDLPLAPVGTPFQQRVWRALRAIPYGRTASYRDVAVAIGQPAAVRAVGLANGRNPLPIVVPCHRVIGSDGSLTGYGGGLEAKRFLLDLERRHAGR